MPADTRSFSDVVQDVIQNVQEIIHSEVRLAKAEVTTEAKKAARAGVALAIGVALGLYAVGFLLLSAVYGLSLAMPSWAAALLVAIIVAIVAAIAVASGRERIRRVHVKPETTIRSVKENVQWLKTRSR